MATLVGVMFPSVKEIAGVVVAFATVPDTPAFVVTETEVTVPLPLPGAAQLPFTRSALVPVPHPVPLATQGAAMFVCVAATGGPVGALLASTDPAATDPAVALLQLTG